jgi:tRNA(Ile)-lysidine synthase
MDIPALRALHPAQRFRLLHQLLTPYAQAGKKEVGLCHVEALDHLLASAVPQGELHLPGVRARRRYDQLTLSLLPVPALLPWSLEISGPGRYRLPSGGELQVEVNGPWSAEAGDAREFVATSLSFPLTVRTVQPGDRMRLARMTGRKRLKELMMEEKIPLEERRRLWVLEKEEILWIVGIRRSALSLPQAGESLLRIIYTPHNSSEIPQMP